MTFKYFPKDAIFGTIRNIANNFHEEGILDSNYEKLWDQIEQHVVAAANGVLWIFISGEIPEEHHIFGVIEVALLYFSTQVYYLN